MDKRKAMLTLTEKLRKAGYVNLIIDPVVKTYLLNTVKHAILDSGKGRIRTFHLSSIDIGDFEKEIVSSIPYSLANMFPQANYFFVEGGSKSEYGDTWRNALVTPAALIGEAEERVLRESFYKDVPSEVAASLDVLKISNFIDAYSIYSSLKGGEVSPLGFGIYRPFRKEDRIELGDIIQGSISKMYYLVDKINSDRSIEGYRFQDEALKTPAMGKKDDNVYGNCDVSYIIPVKKRLSDTNFFDFVFSLPYEDQNIELNKVVLKESINIDCFSILQKEYSTGKYFKDYFSALNREVQKTVVEKIKSLPNQNMFLNSWLFNEGFDVKMSHLELYKTDTKSFISYFERSEKNTQEVIVSDLFNCDYTNKEVIEFLENKYSHLLRDVSFKNEISTSIKKDEQHYVSSSDEAKATSRRGGGGLHKY